MSVVAVKKTDTEVQIAADSIIMRGWQLQEKNKDAKIFKVNERLVIGGAGLCRDVELLRIFMKSNMPAENTPTAIVDMVEEFIGWVKQKDGAQQPDSAFIIVFDGHAYVAYCDLYVREIEDCHAIGAGQDFAMAAMSLGKSAKDAVKCACELSTFCEAPVVSFTMSL